MDEGGQGEGDELEGRNTVRRAEGVAESSSAVESCDWGVSYGVEFYNYEALTEALCYAGHGDDIIEAV